MDFKERLSINAQLALLWEQNRALFEQENSQTEVQINVIKKNGDSASSLSLSVGHLKQLFLTNIANENSEQAILVVDKHHSIVQANKQFTEITGYEREDVLGENIDILEPEQHDIHFCHQYQELLKHRELWIGEFYSRKKDGSVYKQNLAVRPVINSRGEHSYTVLTFNSMTRTLEQLEHFKYLAKFDTLTNLPNRTLLEQNFSRDIALAKRNNKQLGFLYIDLNDFKPVNDVYGHVAGDQVLKVVASRMQSCIRETDMVARVGGDEFVVLLNNININAVGVCDSMSEKIKRLIAIPIDCGLKNMIKISASIGIAKFPDHGDSFDFLLAKADASMYKQKREVKEA